MKIKRAGAATGPVLILELRVSDTDPPTFFKTQPALPIGETST